MTPITEPEGEDVSEATPNLYAELEDVLRCTAFIPEQDIRAKYIATDLRLRGYVIHRVARDSSGRFRSEVPSDAR